MLPFMNGYTLEIDKIPDYPLFSNTFEEDIDCELLKIILNCEDKRIPPENKTLALNCLLDNLKADTLFVKYRNRRGLGRVYAEDDIGLTPQSRYIKNTLYYYAGWRDMDMQKSYPNILLSLWDLNRPANERSLNSLEYYVKNADTIFEKLIDYFATKKQPRLHKDQIKLLFSLVIFGGSPETWKQELANPKPKDIAKGCKPILIGNKPMPKFVDQFTNDINYLKQHIIKSNPKLLEHLKDSKKTYYANCNSLFSYYLGVIENHILYMTYVFMMDLKIIQHPRASLAFDGCCIPFLDLSYNENDLMNQLNTFLRNNTGLSRITWVFKEFPMETILMECIETRKSMVVESKTAIEIVLDNKPILTKCHQSGHSIDDIVLPTAYELIPKNKIIKKLEVNKIKKFGNDYRLFKRRTALLMNYQGKQSVE